LPLAPAVQHTGEIDVSAPLEALWIFGKPAAAFDGFPQASIDAESNGSFVVRAPTLDVEVFGDATDLDVVR
jgi:hypothetical protein